MKKLLLLFIVIAFGGYIAYTQYIGPPGSGGAIITPNVNGLSSGTNSSTNGGTVTSVGFVGDGTTFSSTVSGPITTSGNLQLSALIQTNNTIYRGPTALGSYALPIWGPLNSNDFTAVPGLTAFIVSNGNASSDFYYSVTNQSSSLASHSLYTNTSGAYQHFVIYGSATVITNNTTGILTVQYAWTNELGAQTYTPMSSVSTATTSTDPFAPEYIVVSNNTQVTVSTTQVNTSGTAHWNLYTDVQQH